MDFEKKPFLLTGAKSCASSFGGRKGHVDREKFSGLELEEYIPMSSAMCSGTFPALSRVTIQMKTC